MGEPGPGAPVRIVQLPAPALVALAAGDLATAKAHSPVPLSDRTGSEGWRATWRMRACQVTDAPGDLGWVTGVVVAGDEVVGKAGFHAAPDPAGVVEIGYEIDPDHRGRGFARGALTALVARARVEDGVRRVLASVAPHNAVSLHLVRSAGFVRVGEQWDDEDGLEWVHVLDV